MKKILCVIAGLWLAAATVMAQGSANTATTNTAPGLEAAQAISTITGVAISPLLGVSAVGAWKYWQHSKTPLAQRGKLPWFAQPWFWIPGLVLVGLVFLKDVAGTSMPAAFKKPLDVLEAFENKVSALIAAGLFVPIIAAIFGASATGDSSFYQAAGLAAFDPASLLNVLTVPVAIVAFTVVWLVSNVINVLILISPFGVVDAALKSARFFLLSAVVGVSYVDPYAGAGLSLVIIGICYFLSGWAFRMTVFGTVFGWDFLTFRFTRFQPDDKANRAFLARAIDKVPVRTMGRLIRNEQGRLVFEFRPWLILPRRSLALPEGQYAVGRGMLYPELLLLDPKWDRTVLTLPPRFLGHEDRLTQIYRIEPARDLGLIKGFKAIWLWLKDLAGIRRKTPLAAAT